MFRPITIHAVLNGWVVSVGCQTVVYQDRDQLVRDVDSYLKDPDGTEKRFLASSINRAHTNNGPAQEQAAATPRDRGLEGAAVQTNWNQAVAPQVRQDLR